MPPSLERAMTCTIAQLRELLDTEGLNYFLIPDGSGVMLNVKGADERFQFKIMIELEEEFVQFRSIDYLHCPQGHPHLDATLQVLGEANYRLRLGKFGWDPADGEIAVYVDFWLMDAEITQEQFSRTSDVFMSILDDEYPGIKDAIESGVGPGNSEDPDGEGDDNRVDSL